MSEEDLRAQAARTYEERGLAGRVGLGASPALLVVDLTLGFTDPASPLGAEADGVVAATGELLAAFRARRLPIVFTTCEYVPHAEVWAQKINSHRSLVPGSEAVALDPRLGRRPAETLLVKHFPSAFFGTDLAVQLRALGVDSLVLAGMTTSGCIRATAIDGCSHGFRVTVVREAVGDRARGPHESNLFDIDSKYGDVVALAELPEGLRPGVAVGEGA